MIAVSIISHHHGAMVSRLVGQLIGCQEVSLILVTLNVPEVLNLPEDSRIRIFQNEIPRGFSANHNAAFKESSAEYFCVLNPDIELQGGVFSELLKVLSVGCIAMIAPRVDAPGGVHEDSWRHFPTLSSLAAKLLGRNDGRYVLSHERKPFSPEWVAGMFMLFRSDVYRALGGFDEGFFLYYEDVDICVRLWRAGYRIVAMPTVAIIHDARRDSHRKWRHLRWHLSSMLRYFAKHWGRLPDCTGNSR